MPTDLAALREAWEHELCENGLRRGNCGCSRCLDDLLRRGVAHGEEQTEATLAAVRAKLDELPPDPPRYPYAKPQSPSYAELCAKDPRWKYPTARCVEIIRDARALCDGPEGGSHE